MIHEIPDDAIMLGDGTWIPPRPPEATSTWVITPEGWKPLPSFNCLVAALPVPRWRRVWGWLKYRIGGYGR